MFLWRKKNTKSITIFSQEVYVVVNYKFLIQYSEH